MLRRSKYRTLSRRRAQVMPPQGLAVNGSLPAWLRGDYFVSSCVYSSGQQPGSRKRMVEKGTPPLPRISDPGLRDKYTYGSADQSELARGEG